MAKKVVRKKKENWFCYFCLETVMDNKNVCVNLLIQNGIVNYCPREALSTASEIDSKDTHKSRTKSYSFR